MCQLSFGKGNILNNQILKNRKLINVENSRKLLFTNV
jgi:hypothetical protein